MPLVSKKTAFQGLLKINPRAQHASVTRIFLSKLQGLSTTGYQLEAQTLLKTEMTSKLPSLTALVIILQW